MPRLPGREKGRRQQPVGILRDLYPKDLGDDTTAHVPPIFTAFRTLPPLRHLLGRFIGLGVRPEHVHEALREFAGIAAHPMAQKVPLGVPEKERLRGLLG